METNNQNTQNPYILAQYIVTKPEKMRPLDHLDISPDLEKLQKDLILYFTKLFIRDEFFELVKGSKHPNEILLKLAEKADEICPGRTYSDLLFKGIVVTNMYDSIMKALIETTGRSESKIIVGSFGKFGGLSSLLNNLKS